MSKETRSKETRSPNGDLWFDPPVSDDPIVGARDNLRYWEDRVKRGMAHPATLDENEIPALMNAVRHMIVTVDTLY